MPSPLWGCRVTTETNAGGVRRRIADSYRATGMHAPQAGPGKHGPRPNPGEAA